MNIVCSWTCAVLKLSYTHLILVSSDTFYLAYAVSGAPQSSPSVTTYKTSCRCLRSCLQRARAGNSNWRKQAVWLVTRAALSRYCRADMITVSTSTCMFMHARTHARTHNRALLSLGKKSCCIRRLLVGPVFLIGKQINTKYRTLRTGWFKRSVKITEILDLGDIRRLFLPRSKFHSTEEELILGPGIRTIIVALCMDRYVMQLNMCKCFLVAFPVQHIN
jgi:hypothetical protein